MHACIRRLGKLSGIPRKDDERHVSINRLIYMLMERGILNAELARVTRVVYRECSKIVHGELISDRDARLVLELGLKALVALKKIKSGTNKR